VTTEDTGHPTCGLGNGEKAALEQVAMNTYGDCIPCITRQVRKVSEDITEDAELRERIMHAALNALTESGMHNPPPYQGQKVQRIIRKIAGNPDPYREIKEYFNNLAKEIYPYLKLMVERSEDGFRAAVKIALAGNVIDFGANSEIRLLRTIDQVLNANPSIDHIEDLKKAVCKAELILYLGDNAGETVMDRVLIEEFPEKTEVIYAVRGGPVINDATREDAVAAGLDRVAAILSNGSDAPGTILDDCSEEFRRIFDKADLVISKGMGNFETLCHARDKDIFFLLLVKCDLVARDIGCAKGDSVVARLRFFKNVQPDQIPIQKIVNTKE